MNVFFDVDETIQGYDGSLRPFVSQVFQQLVEDGHKVYVWSGIRTASGVRRGVVDRHGLAPFVTDCFQKPLDQPRAAWSRMSTGVQPDFCVDDRIETIEAFGGFCIAPYLYVGAGTDEELKRAYEAVSQAALSGSRT